MQAEKESHILEIFLVLTVVGLTALLFRTAGYKMVVLNLFYLPVVLAAFFLGRYRAGVLCLLCIVSASIVTVLDIENFAALRSPVVIGLAVTVWGAVLGLTAILVGTLSDERNRQLDELNEAYVGVIEVLSRYLQNADQSLRATSNRVAQTSQKIGQQMGLTTHQLDDIRVAALLHDLEHLEITARVIQRAVGTIEDDAVDSHTFNGTELTASLGSVLTRAFPLIMQQSNDLQAGKSTDPIGARIIRAVRAFDLLVHSSDIRHGTVGSHEALELMRQDTITQYDAEVLDHIEKHINRTPTLTVGVSLS